MAFDFNALVDGAIVNSDVADPKRIAWSIAKQIPDCELRHVLGKTLALTVKRRLAIRLSRLTGGQRAGDQADATSQGGILAQRVSIGEGKWKRLGECTTEDLSAIAAFRRRMVDENVVWARRYEVLAEAIERADVADVAAVRLEVVAAIFS